jgi:hypothetical protein
MAMPLHHPGSLMTLDEWIALPEDSSSRSELQEGVLLVSPRPGRRHQCAAQRLSQQLDEHLPAGWESVLDLEGVVRAGASADSAGAGCGGHPGRRAGGPAGWRMFCSRSR